MNRIHPTESEKKEIKKLKRKIICFILFCMSFSITLLIIIYNLIEN